MVTQTPAFFPAPTAAMVNGAVPTAMGDGTNAQAIPFVNALTQAQTQTQAGMNPRVLALLNGLTSLPSAIGVPILPTLGGTTVSGNPAELDGTPSSQEAAPENANSTLLAMAALCLNPMQTIVEPTMPQIPTQVGAISSQTIPVGAEEMTALAAQIEAAQVQGETLILPQVKQGTIEDTTSTQQLGVTGQPSEQKQTIEIAISPMPLPNAPAQFLEQKAKLGVNIKPVQAQESGIIAIPQNPTQTTQLETTAPQNATAIVSAEPLTLTQGVTKKIAALPMETERAIVLPTLAPSLAKSNLNADTETSHNKGEESSEQAISTLAASVQDKPGNSNAAASFGETLQRVETTAQISARQTEAVSTQNADRYEVAAQVTKHLETMSATGGRSDLVLQLKPEHLGQVKITLSTSETGVSAKIMMDSAQSHQAMTSAKESLRSAFEQRGIHLEALDVSLNQQAFGNGQQTFAGMHMGYSQSQTFGRPNPATQTGFTTEDDTEIPLVIPVQSGLNSLNRLDFRA